MKLQSFIATLLISAAAGLSTPGGVAVAQTLSQPGQPFVSPAIASPKLGINPSVSVTARPKTTIATPEDRHDRNMNRLWISSMVAVAAASGMDAATSWGKREGNGFLASQDGTFGMRGASIKAAMVAGVIVPQVIFRKHKDLRAKFAIGNLAEAGIFTGVSIHNLGVTSSR